MVDFNVATTKAQLSESVPCGFCTSMPKPKIAESLSTRADKTILPSPSPSLLMPVDGFLEIF